MAETPANPNSETPADKPADAGGTPDNTPENSAAKLASESQARAQDQAARYQDLSLWQHLLLSLRWLILPPPGKELPVLGGRLMGAIALLAGIALVSHQTMNQWLDRHLHP